VQQAAQHYYAAAQHCYAAVQHKCCTVCLFPIQFRALTITNTIWVLIKYIIKYISLYIPFYVFAMALVLTNSFQLTNFK